MSVQCVNVSPAVSNQLQLYDLSWQTLEQNTQNLIYVVLEKKEKHDY